MRNLSAKSIFNLIILLTTWVGTSVTVRAQISQPVSLPDTEIQTVRSRILNGETYQLLVHFPDQYDTTKRYDVLYVLDGLDAFPMAISCLGILHGECEKNYQEPILIGISDGAMIGKPGNKRDRDYTPTAFTTKWGASGGGGGPKFLQFIEQEVIPFVEKRYPVKPNRVLYGYSYGGLFASYALLSNPNLFQKVLIGSPSLFADNNVIVRKLLPDYAHSHTDLSTKVWLSVGQTDENLIDDTKEFASALQSKNYPSLQIESTVLPGLNHLTGIQPTMLQALKWAFCTVTPTK
ncbi:alpha/beta hydrolase-fold protein [Spirosoma knui]